MCLGFRLGLGSGSGVSSSVRLGKNVGLARLARQNCLKARARSGSVKTGSLTSLENTDVILLLVDFLIQDP